MSNIKIGDYVRSTLTPQLYGRVEYINRTKAWIVTDDNKDTMERLENLVPIESKPVSKEGMSVQLKLIARHGKLYPILSVAKPFENAARGNLIATVFDADLGVGGYATICFRMTEKEYEEAETFTFTSK